MSRRVITGRALQEIHRGCRNSCWPPARLGSGRKPCFGAINQDDAFEKLIWPICRRAVRSPRSAAQGYQSRANRWRWPGGRSSSSRLANRTGSPAAPVCIGANIVAAVVSSRRPRDGSCAIVSPHWILWIGEHAHAGPENPARPSDRVAVSGAQTDLSNEARDVSHSERPTYVCELDRNEIETRGRRTRLDRSSAR